jgi:hypothetical protein
MKYLYAFRLQKVYQKCTKTEPISKIPYKNRKVNFEVTFSVDLLARVW